jgi:hypothetical protein
MIDKDNEKKDQTKELEIKSLLTFEELEAKVAPAIRLNHNETLIRDLAD